MLWCLSVGARSLVIWDSHVSGGRPTGRLCGEGFCKDTLKQHNIRTFSSLF